MAKNDYRVTSIFKLIIRNCMKLFEFCGKTSTFLPKSRLLISCIFYYFVFNSKTSNKLYFRSLIGRLKCTVNKHRELNFCHKFYLFIQVCQYMGLVFDCSIGSFILMLVSQMFELASHCLVYSNH